MMELLSIIWPHLMAAGAVVISIVASAHVVLHKRDTRAATGWVGIIWLAPVIGAALYSLLGINRIRRRAYLLRKESPRRLESQPAERRAPALIGLDGHMKSLATLIDGVTRRPLVAGNAITPLYNGDEAYPAMLAAIAEAQQSVALCTYIFDNDEVGGEFVDALAAAVERKVEVRVLVDAVGIRYSLPTIYRKLRRRGIPVTRFSRTVMPWRWPYFNLRTHRKILVVDGRIGFAGGMNIRAGHRLAEETKAPVRDLHFRLEGPVVAHLSEVFMEDWHFAAGERLEGERWLPPLQPRGEVVARGISDGPDEDFEGLRWAMLGALGCAESRVRIVTPYFLPDAGVATALKMAAMRGVEVTILLPRQNNLRLVQWACNAGLGQFLRHGCHIFLSPPPFEHTKVMLVDEAWALFGSANWDDRSLQLNFELSVEAYDRALVAQLDGLIAERLATAHRLTAKELDERALPIKVRDGVARLFSPYL